MKRKYKTYIIIYILFIIYALLFIYRTSFIIDGERYFSLFDDAMISMRYAKNLASGYGLVFNPGCEKVEGYTNLLWILYMSLFHLLPIPLSKTSLFIQISALIILVINLHFVRKIAYLIPNNSNKITISAILLTAFYLPINNWSLQGMEVSILMLITSITTYLLIKSMKDNKINISSYLLLGLSMFIRPDIIALYIAIFIFLTIIDTKNRRKNILFGLLILFLSVFIQTIFRYYYYNDILPNTYYLKMTGYPFTFRIATGLYAFLKFVWHSNPILFLLPFTLLLSNHSKNILLLFLIFLVQVFFSIYVGGDVWEIWGGSNRFISIAMPLFFILFSLQLFNLHKLLSNEIEKIPKLSKVVKRYLIASLFPFMLFISLFNFNSIYGPKAISELLLLNPPLHITDNKRMVEVGLIIKDITTQEAKIGVVWAGALSYFSERHTIDFLGKNDRFISHEKMKITYKGISKIKAFYPGHMKYNYDYSIGKLRPDIIVQLWGPYNEQKLYIEKLYTKFIIKDKYVFFILKGTNNIIWENLYNLNGRIVK